MKKEHFLALVFFNLVFAGSMGMTKWGMSYLPPLLFSGVRFFCYAMILTPFLRWYPGRMVNLFAIAMSAGALSFGLIYMGVNIAGDLTSIVVTLQLGLPFTTILAMIFLGEHIHWRRWLGMALAFGGVMVISFDPRVFAYIDGMAIGALGALVGATSTILMRKSRDIGVFNLQAWIAMFSWPVLMVLSFVSEGNPVPLIASAGWQAWTAIAFTVLGSNLIAHAGMYWLLQRYEASFISPFGMMGTLFTVAIGVLFLGDVITWRMALGAVIALSGVLIISIRTAQSKETHVRPAAGILAEMEPMAAAPRVARRSVPSDQTPMGQEEMTVIDRPSPNLDDRPEGTAIDTLIMHYTGMKTGAEAIDRLCDLEAKVSAHYVVEEDGRVFRLVPEEKRAWHAGLSHWAGRDRLNDCSIGIEIVNPGHEFGYRPFPRAQMDAVIDLSRGILARHPAITPDRVIGHSDIAPDRKEDPGELFDWQRLALKGIGRFIDPGSIEPLAGQDLKPGDESWQVQEFQNNLKSFGYAIEVTGVFDEATSKVLTAFQRHFRPEALTGIADIHTQELLRAYLNWRG